tara:strand:+ start:938 stop:1894 length:957 start_codon:yes stop_codon:yes gene_type:complete
MECSQQLSWSPLFADYQSGIGKGTYLISPFIQLEALQELLESKTHCSNLQVITRWKPDDIVSGVSDIEIFGYLKQKEISLFIHDEIHLKMLVCRDSTAFQSSGNITKSGLGLSEVSNVEIGAWCDMTSEDVRKLDDLLANCVAVNDEMYNQAQEYVKQHKELFPPLPRIEWKVRDMEQEFSRQALPSSPSPSRLWEYYQNLEAGRDDAYAFKSDLVKYGIKSEGLSREQFFAELEANFKQVAFVGAFVEYLKSHDSLNFGKARKWLSQNCSERPAPKPWEMSTVLNRLYDWLQELYDEITWDVPGRRSEVIYWHHLPR